MSESKHTPHLVDSSLYYLATREHKAAYDALLETLHDVDSWLQNTIQAIHRPAWLDKKIMDTIAQAEKEEA